MLIKRFFTFKKLIFPLLAIALGLCALTSRGMNNNPPSNPSEHGGTRLLWGAGIPALAGFVGGLFFFERNTKSTTQRILPPVLSGLAATASYKLGQHLLKHDPLMEGYAAAGACTFFTSLGFLFGKILPHWIRGVLSKDPATITSVCCMVVGIPVIAIIVSISEKNRKSQESQERKKFQEEVDREINKYQAHKKIFEAGNAKYEAEMKKLNSEYIIKNKRHHEQLKISQKPDELEQDQLPQLKPLQKKSDEESV